MLLHIKINMKLKRELRHKDDFTGLFREKVADKKFMEKHKKCERSTIICLLAVMDIVQIILRTI